MFWRAKRVEICENWQSKLAKNDSFRLQKLTNVEGIKYFLEYSLIGRRAKYSRNTGWSGSNFEYLATL